MLNTQELILDLAPRIEKAFLRRYPDWSISRTSSGVWDAAASALLQLRDEVPWIPVDAELFVAVQPRRAWGDPWTDLTHASATHRYRVHVRRIVAQLRSEIKLEVGRAEKKVRRGASVLGVLSESNGGLSALGRYVVARRAGLDDLAERLRPEAERQHRSCPLYARACRTLLKKEFYPLPRQTALLPGLVIPAGIDLPCFSLN